jgi:hypothetical protein
LGKNTGHLLLHEIICSRQHCDLVGNLFNRLTDGSFFDSLKKDSRGCGDPCTIDRFLALYFREHNVHVGMYRNVAGVICSSVTCPPGQKYLFNDESNDFEATKAMMWALTVKLKGWLPSLVWKFENVGNEAESAL